MASPKTNQQLHIAMFPWLAFGHIIPFLELAKLIAQNGHRVSFISTLKNIQRLPPPPPLIEFVSLPLPRHENLPENVESTMEVPPHKVPFLKLAYDGLKDPLTQFLETNALDFIIHDFVPHWLPDIAAQHGVTHAFFSIFPSYSIAYFGPWSELVDGDGSEDLRVASLEKFTGIPEWVPFPTEVRFRPHEMEKNIWLFKGNPYGVSDRFRLGSVIKGCDAVLVRGCEELHSEWLDLLRELHQRPVIPVGLMPPTVQDGGDDTWHGLKSWLDKQEKCSVVYVALGSEVAPTLEELTELAHGLELSNAPFLWALRTHRPGSAEFGNSFKLPEGFEDRVKDRGVVWTSWAPQTKILSHASVGGFLTHCGWSSVIEGLGFGQPLIMLPIVGDQPLNARVVERELKAGVEIGKDERDGSLSRDSVADSVKLVMKREEGKGYREKANGMKKIFGSKDLQEKYTNKFVKYLQTHCCGNHHQN